MNAKPPESKGPGLWTTIGIPVVLALLVGSSSPWWWNEFKGWIGSKEAQTTPDSPSKSPPIGTFTPSTKSYDDEIRDVELAIDGVGGATFEVRYSLKARARSSMTIAVLVYSAGAPKSPTGPAHKGDIRLLGEGQIGVVVNDGTASVNVKKSFVAPTETSFIEVQLRDADKPILVKQFPFTQVWMP